MGSFGSYIKRLPTFIKTNTTMAIKTLKKDFFLTTSPNVQPSVSDNTEAVGEMYRVRSEIEIPRGAESYVDESGTTHQVTATEEARSMMSNLNIFRLKKCDGTNYPLLDSDSDKHKSLYTNPTADMLIKNGLGAALYRPEDFIFLEKYNKVPLTHMVTLRRFVHPVMDDIYSSIQTEPDIARLVTYMEQEQNKQSDLLSFSCGIKWKNLESSIEQSNMIGHQEGISGFARSVLKYIDPVFGQNSMRGENALNFNPYHDQNKVYGPVDSITSTHIRDRGLDFSQTFKLVFEYRAQSYNGVNTKAVMLDIFSNILLMCTNDAKFWGGARYYLGARPTKYLHDLKFLSPKNFDEFLGGATTTFKKFLGQNSGTGKGMSKDQAVDMLKNVATNALNYHFGKLLDKIGRPGIPYMNSLLTGNPVGVWHLTIGNPLNPIASIGNLITTDTPPQIEFGDDLGLDGFPDYIRVTIELKHAMPRGRAEIETMFNAGHGRMYLKPKSFNISRDSKKKAQRRKPKLAAAVIDAAFDALKTGKFSTEAIERNAKEMFSFQKNAKVNGD